MNRTVYRNIFKEYNIDCSTPKKRKRCVKRKPKRRSYEYDEEHTIENFSEDEHIVRSYQYVQLKRSFENPLKAVVTQKNSKNEGNESRLFDNGLFCGGAINVGMVPQPVDVVPQEQIEEIHLSWRSSTASSITVNATSTAIREAKLEAALNSGHLNACQRRNSSLPNNCLIISPTPKCSKRRSCFQNRYPNLDIRITKKASFTSTPCRKRLNSSLLSSDEEPYQRSAMTGAKSFVCSSTKPYQIAKTPKSTTSPRTAPTTPSELDLLIEQIEKENAAKSPNIKKSSRKTSNNCLEISPTPKCSKRSSCSPNRYPTLDITITKKITPRRSPRIASLVKASARPSSCCRNLNSSLLPSDEEPIQQRSAMTGSKSFVCSSPKPYQIVKTLNSTPSPRKAPTRPSEIDFLVERIEKENSQSPNIKKSFRETSNNCLAISPTPKCSKISLFSPKRYPTLDITITKEMPPRRSARIASLVKVPAGSPSCRRHLNSSLLSSHEEPFQQRSAMTGSKSFVCSSPKPSQIVETSTPSPRKTPTRPSELDLLIEQIEKENSAKAAKTNRSHRKSSKRCRPGGFVEMYQRCLAKAKMDGKFLKHDKKYGIESGVTVCLVKVECLYNVHVAKVQRVQGKDKKIFGIVLPPEMAAHLKSSSTLEVFFDETCKPYLLPDSNGENIEVYIKPHKLLLA